MPSSRRSNKKIFISHSGRDRSFVLHLRRVLEQHRIPYWYSAEHIRGAQQWHDEIGRALDECNWFLVVLTPAAVRSLWVKRELFFALSETRYDGRIIPLLRKPSQYRTLSWTLGQFEFVDFTGDFAAACQQLLRIWGIKYQPEEASGRSRPKKKTR
jgi:hypothetical protein